MRCDVVLMAVHMYTPLYLCIGADELFTTLHITEWKQSPPCLTHVENVHSGRSPVFDCKIVKLCLKWNQTPKDKELLLHFNYNLTTNLKCRHPQIKLKHPVC